MPPIPDPASSSRSSLQSQMRVHLDVLIGSFDCTRVKIEGWGISFLSSLGLDSLLLRFAISLSTKWFIYVDSPFSEYFREVMGEADLSQLPEFGSRQEDTLISASLIDLVMAYEVSRINYGT